MPVFRNEEYQTDLFYEVVGEGVPFLLIHGWAIDHAFLMHALEPVFSMCDKSFQRIYVDLPGMGKSKPGLVKNGDGIVAALLDLMESLYPDRPFYVGGNSFGAAISRAILAKIPEKIKGCMLIVPSNGAGEAKVPKNGCFVKDEAFLSTLSDKQRADFSQMNANLTKEAWERFEEYAYPSVLGNDDNEFLHKVLKGRFSFDVEAALKKRRFAEPVLILTGKYDTAVGYEAQFDWLSYFPKATYAVLDGAGHNIHIDQPELFGHTAAGWIEAL